jgi:hypothetical protein
MFNAKRARAARGGTYTAAWDSRSLAAAGLTAVVGRMRRPQAIQSSNTHQLRPLQHAIAGVVIGSRASQLRVAMASAQRERPFTDLATVALSARPVDAQVFASTRYCSGAGLQRAESTALSPLQGDLQPPATNALGQHMNTGRTVPHQAGHGPSSGHGS